MGLEIAHFNKLLGGSQPLIQGLAAKVLPKPWAAQHLGSGSEPWSPGNSACWLRCRYCPGRVARLVRASSCTLKGWGSIPGQGTYLGFGFTP